MMRMGKERRLMFHVQLCNTPHRSRLRQRSHLSTAKDPLVIVGGGPTGLFMSNLLSQYGVPNVLLERQTKESRFRHPQAHFLNTRTVELLKYNLPPSAYTRFLQAMPPVDHWNHFRFTYSMSEIPLAQVVHPVDRPLQAVVDANGVLVDDVTASLPDNFSVNQSKSLSPCSVGHLAQHTFCKILHDLADQHAESEIRYGTAVTAVTRDPTSQQMKLTCHDNSSYLTPVVIAADGAQSSLRTTQQIPWQGTFGIQNLMNIHVTLDPRQARKLHEHGNHAMLYSIFNEHVVAMVVCHSLGDYIVQIPFFPPYQTVEEDFSNVKVDAILKAVFGDKVQSWTVQSAKPWRMSSAIAQEYFRDGVVLLGDAAHVFPPAGGFGMNSGLQDAHNLAWKLALYYHRTRDNWALDAVLRSYQEDRRPVAQENAALSIRNYHRLLEVTKSCYLNEKHPNMLVGLLASSPLPLVAKQTMFRSLFQAALLPLSWLKSGSSSMYASHLRNNLRKVLREGSGLPLLFPKYELGFIYRAERSAGNWREDTDSFSPSIKVGALVPHVEVSFASFAAKYPNLRFTKASTISTSNLPAQLSHGSCPPPFVVLAAGQHDVSLVDSLRMRLAEAGLSVETVWINAEDGPEDGLCLRESDLSEAAFSFRSVAPLVVVIRPDSHVCAMSNNLIEGRLDSIVDEAIASFQVQCSNANGIC